jgi:hypothetical protein
MMLDRTGSMFSGSCSGGVCIADEKTAAKGLLNLYGALAPDNPQVGVGRIADGSTNSAEIIGQLTDIYGSDTPVNNTQGYSYPTGTATSTWVNPDYGRTNNTQYATSDINGQQLGYNNFGFNIPAGSNIDGIEVAVGGYAIGGGSVNTGNLVPSNVGNYNNWSGVPTNTDAGKVSAVLTNDSDTSYVSTSPVAIQTFVVANAGVPAGSTINSVTLFAVARALSGTPNIKLRIEKGTSAGSQFDSPANTLNSSYQTYSLSMATNPFTGSAWTISEVNSWTSRFGVYKSNSSGTARVTQLYVVVNYTPTSASGQIAVSLSWNNGSGWSNSITQNFAVGESTYTLGGPTNNWGRTWAAGELNNTKFLLRVQNNSPSGVTVYLNYNAVKVYYSIPSSGLYYQINTGLVDNGGYTNLGAAISFGSGELNSIRHETGLKKVLILISDGKPTRPSGNTSQDTQTALNSADTAKTSKGPANDFVTEIFTIHFGDTTGRNLLAQLASGGTSVSGHQPGSANDQSSASAENNDGDNFYISPTSSDLLHIFTDIGKKVCPAAAGASQATLNVLTQVVNTNGGLAVPADFHITITGANPSPSTFVGSDSGTSVIVDPGVAFSISETGPTGYYPGEQVACPSSVALGQTAFCTIVFYDTPPPPTYVPPPPPPENIDIGSWVETPNGSP